jgi:hypothetical protein
MARGGATKKKEKSPSADELSQLKKELRRSPLPEKSQPDRSM